MFYVKVVLHFAHTKDITISAGVSDLQYNYHMIIVKIELKILCIKHTFIQIQSNTFIMKVYQTINTPHLDRIQAKDKEMHELLAE